MSVTLTVRRLKADPRRPQAQVAIDDENNAAVNEVVAQRAAQASLRPGEYNFALREGESVATVSAPTEEKASEKFEVRVPLSFIQQAAARAEYKESLQRELILYIPFFVIFVLLIVVDSGVEGNYFSSWSIARRLYDRAIPPISQEIGPNFGRTFASLLTPNDWNRWASGSFLDHHFARVDTEDPQVLGANLLGGPNIQLGAARFRVLRVNDNSCSLNGQWLPTNASLFPQECFSPYSSSINTSSFGPPSKPLQFPYASGCYFGYVVGDMATYDCSGNYFDVALNNSRTDAATAVSSLLPSSGFTGFFDPLRTRFISTAFFAYNPSSDYFFATTVWQEYSATGTFVPGWRSVPFRLYTPRWSASASLTVVFVIMVLIHLVGYFASIVDAAKRGKLLDRLLNVWMLLDVANIISLAVLFGFRFTWWQKSQAMNYTFSIHDGYNTDLEYMATVYDGATFSATISTLLVFLRILKFNTLSSRLGVINRTLEAAAQNLLNLLVIFSMVVLSYAVMATALFGSALKQFYSYDVAISSLLRMLIGDFDYDGLKQEQWYLAALFFWSYMILGLFLLLNMMIAVIGDSFESEQSAAAGAPISDEIAEFFKGAFRTVRRFFANPAGAFSDAMKYSKMKFAQRGKYSMIAEQTRALRFSLPCEHVTADQFALLSSDEQEAVLSNPKINRYELDKAFDTEEMKQYLGAKFLDDFWLEVIAEYRFFRDEHVHQVVAKRKARIKVAGSQALRAILAEPIDALDCRAAQIFKLPQECLETLQTIATNLDAIEASTKNIGETAAKVNAAQLRLHFGLDLGGGAAASGGPSPTRGGANADRLLAQMTAVSTYRKFLRTTTARVPEF